MKALVYHGPGERGWDTVDDPTILDPTDAIVRIDTSTICGADLHILKGDVPETTPGTVLGHEAVGTIQAVGAGVSTVAPGDQVLMSCVSSCSRCRFCKEGRYGQCLGRATSSSRPTTPTAAVHGRRRPARRTRGSSASARRAVGHDERDRQLPGQAWLWLYALWYQVEPIKSSLNADIQVMLIMGLLSLAFVCIPFLPGIRSLPRKIPIYKLIWKEHYDAQQSA
jgi:hypothetical protein